ncbi:MAG: DUF1223 domain-containing protein [Bauldia sp.]|nr:DUF1223 domain-containing protein [Bauldia sp.]
MAGAWLRRFGVATGLGMLSLGGWAATALAQSQPIAVLELFTSQACGSCPAADALLARYIESGEVVALSFSVDYWDYLGWPDTLARHENTVRQKAYADGRGDMQLYTPQMVVNGELAVVGSDKQAIDTAILATSGLFGLPVAVSVTMTSDALRVSIEGAPSDDIRTASVWLAAFDRYETVPVGRGENGGRTLSYHNVVRNMHRVAMWRGQAMSLDIPLSMLREAGADGCAILLQSEASSGVPGRVLGAATLIPRGGYALTSAR